MKNIEQEIIRSNRLVCTYCGIWGAGLGCKKVESCGNTYHYLCAIQENSGCELDFENYLIYC